MTVPDEAVEEAARAHQDLIARGGRPRWGELSPSSHQWRIDCMRVTLTAAAPFIAAQAWDEGARAMFVDDPLAPTPTNPYRSGT